MLIANQGLRLRDATDGTSNVIIVAEISAFLKTAAGTLLPKETSRPQSWIAGTNSQGTPPNYRTYPPFPGAPGETHNLVTIRYAPNEADGVLPGLGTGGINNPISSSHRGGAQVLLTDGSVRFLGETVDLTTFKRLATRDDGVPVGEF